MINNKNIIIIGATGRNNGKTEFACNLIKQLSEKHEVIGVKVTTIKEDGEKCPRGEHGCGVCSSLTTNYELTEEKNILSQKDTAKMLRAGANKVFWLRVFKKSLDEGVNELLYNIPSNVVVVCESNSVRFALKPGLFIIIKNSLDNLIKKSCKEVYHFADKIIVSDGKEWNFHPERIQFYNNRWRFCKKETATLLLDEEVNMCGKA